MSDQSHYTWRQYESCVCDLSDEQIEAEALEVVKFLQGRGIDHVRLESPTGIAQIAVEEIPEAILQGISEDRFEKWKGNWGTVDITLFAEDIELEFCHHDGIHLRADEKTHFPKFEERWHSLGYAVDLREGRRWQQGRNI